MSLQVFAAQWVPDTCLSRGAYPDRRQAADDRRAVTPTGPPHLAAPPHARTVPKLYLRPAAELNPAEI